MDKTAPESLIEHFSKLEDPRIDRNKKHELIDVIVLCVCAVVSGAEGWSDIEEFGHTKLEWLRRYVPLANGIPVDDTIARIISALSVRGFQECFMSWMEDVVKLSGGEIIAVDGKTHRRTHDRKRGVKALHMVSAWACGNGVVLGQVKTDEKSNEITAVPELLDKLELSGCIVTLDAMGCQRAIAKQVKEGGGDYVLGVKGNQKKLNREVRQYFDMAGEQDFKGKEIENEVTAEDGHGRVEYRSYFLSTDLSVLSDVKKWNGLRAIGMVESERYIDGRASIEQRYYITSLEDVESFRRAVRSHWGIENELHWRLDVTFREDESRIRRGNAPHNMGVIRHVALNLLKREPTKISVRKKRIRAALNDGFRFSTRYRFGRQQAYATIAYSLSEGMVMHSGQYVFSQIMEYLPMKTFRRCVQRYQGNRRIQSFTCLDQFLCMAFAQLTYRESLRDIEACLRVHKDKLYHMGIRGGMSRNTLANANQRRDWRIYAEFAQAMIRIARPLYADEDLGLDLDNTVYALDASTIDLCLSVFPWALFRSTKSAVKLHTLLDLRGNIPTFIHVSDGKMHDVNVLDILTPEPGAFYIMDRGYVDFERLFLLHSIGAFTRYERRYSHSIDKATGVRCDQTVVLTGAKGKKHYPQPIRRIKYYDKNTQKSFNFLTNHFAVPALTVAELYRYRWQVELFFKWIKQHLRIKSFFGTSENAVKSQIWIAVTVYVLVAVIKKRLDISADLYTILQILSLTLFEKMPLFEMFSGINSNLSNFNSPN